MLRILNWGRPAAPAPKVTIEEAQEHIPGVEVAKIIREFQTEFRGAYPDEVLAMGIGPVQTFLGLAIRNQRLARIGQNGGRK